MEGQMRERRRQERGPWEIGPVLLAVACAAVLLFFLGSMPLGKSHSYDLTVAVVDRAVENETQEELQEALQSGLGQSGSSARVRLTAEFASADERKLEQLQVLAADHALDVVVMPESLFRAYAGQGYFTDLEKVLPGQLLALPEHPLVRCRGYRESRDVEDDGAGRGKKKAYGICLAGKKGKKEALVLGVVVSGRHKKLCGVLAEVLLKRGGVLQ